MDSIFISGNAPTVKRVFNDWYEYCGVEFSKTQHPPDRVKACTEYRNFGAADVLIQTVPRSGSHLTWDLVYDIHREAGLVTEDRGFTGFESKFTQIVEGDSESLAKAASLDDIDNITSPKILSTHLPWFMMPPQARDGVVKVINVRRNPKDRIVSASDMLQKLSDTGHSHVNQLDKDEWITVFTAGKNPFGEVFMRVKDWYDNRNRPSMLSLVYEEMVQDLRGAVVSICNFLEIKLTDEQLEIIVDRNKYEKRGQSIKDDDVKQLVLGKRGCSGGWKTFFTSDQNKRLDTWIARRMQELGLNDKGILKLD